MVASYAYRFDAELLSDEILERILSQVAVRDLLRSAVAVCRHWHRIISSDNFIPWKKAYFRLKRGTAEEFDGLHEDAKQFLRAVADEGVELLPGHSIIRPDKIKNRSEDLYKGANRGNHLELLLPFVVSFTAKTFPCRRVHAKRSRFAPIVFHRKYQVS